MSPILTIIVPIYKVEPYLRQCIDSILNQTWEEFELILIDDGSPDKCGEICDEYSQKDQRIKVIHQENKGLSAARNNGVDIARGKYLTFIDSDDWLKPDMYETLITLAETYNTDIAECGYVKAYDNGLVENINFSYSIQVIDGITALQDFHKGIIRRVVVWNKIYRKTLWENIRFPVGKVHEDEFTTYKLYYKADRILQLDAGLMYYRQRPDSFIGKGFEEKKFANFREAFQEKQEFFHREGLKSLQDLAGVETTASLMDAYLEMHKQKRLRAKARQIKKQFNRELKYLQQTADVSLKHRALLSLFYISPVLYLVFRKYEIAPRLKQNRNFKTIYAWLINNKAGDQIKQQIKSMAKQKNIYLFMVPLHGNLGDQAIVYAQTKLAAEYFPDYNVVEILHRDTKAGVRVLKKLIKNDDLIWLPGGGNMGDEYISEEQARRYIIKHFLHNKIVSFPQTIYFSPTDYGRRELSNSRKIYEKNKNLTLIAREQVSYEIMQKEFPKTNVMLIPDIVFYLNQVKANRERQGILCCLRNDVEGVINFEQKLELLASLKKLCPELTATDTVLGREVDSDTREKELEEIWEAFRMARVVITDRLHGMIFAAITATPCVVLSNYNHKVQSSHQWLQGLDYIRFVKEYDQETVLQQVDDLFNLDSRQLPRSDLSGEFKVILELCKHESR